jgi:Tetratricopeptide repeat
VTRRSLTGEGRKAALTQALGWVNAAFVGDPGDVRTWPVLDPLAPHAGAVTHHADAAAIPEPTARLMNELGSLFYAKAVHAQAEPLMRRALAIDEASFGPDHPNVAIRLNNLAALLQATNRLAEAEPLSRRQVRIFLDFTRRTGHEHPHLQAAFGNYAGLLQAMGRSEAEIRAEIETLVRETGLSSAASPAAEAAPEPQATKPGLFRRLFGGA